MSVLGKIHSEDSFSTLDGPGTRYVVFMQGCILKCKYCHNVDSWDKNGGYSSSALEMVQRIIKYRSFIEGVTLSGGEPLLQAEFCREVFDGCKANKLDTAVDTSGAVPISRCEKAVSAADYILLDIKSSDAEVCRELTGMDNRNSLELLDWCERNSKPVWIRHVLIKGYTLDKKQLINLGKILSDYSCIEKVTLLPFHKMGEHKWKMQEEKYELMDTPVPNTEEIAWAKELVGMNEKRIAP